MWDAIGISYIPGNDGNALAMVARIMERARVDENGYVQRSNVRALLGLSVIYGNARLPAKGEHLPNRTSVVVA